MFSKLSAAHAGLRAHHDLHMAVDAAPDAAAPIHVNDSIVGGPGDETLRGTDGHDVIIAGPDTFEIDAMGGADYVSTGATPAYLVFGYADGQMGLGVDGGDTLVGGAGQQYMAGDAGNDSLSGGAGDDFLYGATATSSAQVKDGSDYLDGGAGDDVLRGNYGKDTLVGGDGDDNLGGQWGNDTLEGGDGFDRASFFYYYETAGLNVSFAKFRPGEAQSVRDGLGGHDQLSGIEALVITGTFSNDTIVGSVADDTINSTGGDDQLSGGAGRDSVVAYQGHSQLSGGDGDDRLTVNAFSNHLSDDGRLTTDAVDTLDGGAGVDAVTLNWWTATSDVHLTLGADGQLLGASGDGLIGVVGSGIETLAITSGEGADVIAGAGGNDVIDGGSGDDTLAGGGGYDVYALNANHTDGGPDIFTFDGSTLNTRGGASVISSAWGGRDVVSGFEAVSIVGTLGGDAITGSAGADVLSDGTFEANAYGGYGPVTINGAGGDDLVRAGLYDVQETLNGGKGFDTLQLTGLSLLHVDLAQGVAWDTAAQDRSVVSNFEAVVASNVRIDLTGSDVAEHLVGAGLNDTISAGGGNDTVAGGGGQDVLSGGAGADTFVYVALADSSGDTADLIQDLENADTIDLSAIDADRVATGDQAFHLVNHFGGHAGELVVDYAKVGGRTYLMGDVDGDGKADLTILVTGDHRDYTNFQL